MSITFRTLSPEAVIDLAVQAGLSTIEWGGDVHVPHGDLSRAREVRERTEAAGLSVAAYGSYYRVGKGGQTGADSFEAVLDTASELGAPRVRVWAGEKGSAETDAAARARVVADALRIAELASARDMACVFEYHRWTLTDTVESVRKLMAEVAHPAMLFYWQPPFGFDATASVESLRQVLPRLAGLHVYHWTGAGETFVRHPLAEGKEAWRQYLSVAHAAGRACPALLEYVLDDRPEQLIEDARTLKTLLKELA